MRILLTLTALILIGCSHQKSSSREVSSVDTTELDGAKEEMKIYSYENGNIVVNICSLGQQYSQCLSSPVTKIDVPMKDFQSSLEKIATRKIYQLESCKEINKESNTFNQILEQLLSRIEVLEGKINITEYDLNQSSKEEKIKKLNLELENLKNEKSTDDDCWKNIISIQGDTLDEINKTIKKIKSNYRDQDIDSDSLLKIYDSEELYNDYR